MTVYGNQAEWIAATENIEMFSTSSSNISRANEIHFSPGGNSDLGSILTLDSTSTGLSRSFTLMSLSIPPHMTRGLVLDDSEAGLGGPRNISIGDADGIGDPLTRSMYENDDWRIDIHSGPPLTAFAFTLIGNNESLAESLKFYSGEVLIGSIESLGTINNVRFFGVTTTEPITRIEFDEDEFDPGPDYDDIAIRDFQFAQLRQIPTAVSATSWAMIKTLFR
jgi:hypothetical protein